MLNVVVVSKVVVVVSVFISFKVVIVLLEVSRRLEVFKVDGGVILRSSNLRSKSIS